MNTPKPCVTCRYLYWDCMAEDDPSYMAECKLGLLIPPPNEECEEYCKDDLEGEIK